MKRKKQKPRETRLWQFDPSVFQPGPKARFFERHILARARSISKYVLYLLAFLYPPILVSLGIAFGGIVFWSSLAGSTALMWFIIKKAGYAQNFADWNVGYKKFLGLIGAFFMYLSFIYGLAYTPLKIMTIPVMAGLLLIALFLGVWKLSNR